MQANASRSMKTTKVIKPDPFHLSERKDATLAKGAILDAPARHKTHKSQRKIGNMWRLIFFFVEISLISILIFFFPPANILFIVSLIILITALSYTITFFLGKTAQILIAIFVFLFLSISYYIGFDLINTLLLASFIIGLSQLFKIK